MANFNPIMDDEFYFDGMHNSGVYNTFNHSVYSYCYQNPIKLIDPNGKQVESEYLGSWSTGSSFANGMIDGFIDNLPGWGALKEIGKLTTDSKYRAQLIDMIKTIAANPKAFLEKVAKDKIDTYKAFFNGTATDKQMYEVGVDFGGILPGLIGGGMALKLMKDLKKSGVKTALKQLCFVEGTLVLTSKGLKKIEEIQVGDKVWSFNEQTGEIELKEVVSLSQNTAKELIEITIGNEKIVCTSEHPFFVANNWVEAKDLKAGDKLTLKDGTYVVVFNIKQLDKTEKVYNFEVAENHNYYVSELGVLVHNNCDFKMKSSDFGAKIANDTFDFSKIKRMSKETIEETIDMFKESIKSRKAEYNYFSRTGKGTKKELSGHAKRITLEENYLRSLEKQLKSKK